MCNKCAKVTFLLSLFLALSALRVFCQEREFEVTESNVTNAFVGRIFEDQDIGDRSSFNFDSSDCSNYFNIDADTSEIRTKTDLDREEVLANTTTDNLDCIVVYTSTNGGESMALLVRIRILDINDQIPKFFDLRTPTDTVDVVETISAGSTIIPLQPVDNDKGLNGTVVFSITEGNEEGVFRLGTLVGSSTIWLFLNKTVDFESQNQLNLTIHLTDMGEPEPLSSIQTLLINIQNTDDEPPTFMSSNVVFNVSENHLIGEDNPIGAVTVMDSDSATSVNYQLYANPGPIDEVVATYIGVNAFTGEIYFRQRIDYDRDVRMRQLKFEVEARNPGDIHVTRTRVTVDIFDANDEPPHFTHFQMDDEVVFVPLYVVENSEELITVPPLVVNDADFSPEFQIISNTTSAVYDPPATVHPPDIQISRNSFLMSSILYVSINETLDRETISELTLHITLSNMADPHLEGTVTIHIQVLDLNDNNPEFTKTEFQGRVAEGSPLSKEVLRVLATDPDYGENGTVIYSIDSISKPEAGDWFEIDPLSGVISLQSMVDYDSINGSVVLTVAARDNGTLPVNATEHISSTTAVTITISPAVTFLPRSYQEFTGYNIFEGDNTTVYFEFRTTLDSGLLLYQIDSQNRAFSVMIENGEVQYQYGSASASQLMATHPSDDISPGGNPVSTDEWYSVLIRREQEMIDLQVWEADSTDERSLRILLNSSLAGCDDNTAGAGTQGSVLYVGGVDILLFAEMEHTTNTTAPTPKDFVGSIRNLVIGTTQLDLACASRERNIAIFSSEQAIPNSCDSTCSTVRSTGCVDYGEQAFCNCLGGFSPQACQTDADYAPISFEGSGRAELSLGYSFFYDLALHSNLSPPALVSERRRRETLPTTLPTEGDDVLEVVQISFRPKQSGSRRILHSETQTSSHVLQINEAIGGEEQSLIYTVFLSDETRAVPLHIPLEVTFTPGKSYTAIIVITGRSVSMTVLEDGNYRNEKSMDWELGEGSTVQLFAQAPQTNISIGGVSEDTQTTIKSFNGCITDFLINGIEIPLSGMASLGDGGGFQDITTGCDLCDIVDDCPVNSTCIPKPLEETFECSCIDGFTADLTSTEDSVKCLPIPPTTDAIFPTEQTATAIPFYLIIVVALAGVILLGIFVIVFILCCRYHRREKEKHTYRISRTEEQMSNGHAPGSKPNLFSPRDATHQSNSSITNDIESVMTYQQHDIGDDEEMSIPPHFSRRKSTTSAETGFHTGSERASIPRMDDSGNEKETDYSQFESDSEDLTTSYVEEVLSPSGVDLVGSRNGMMGVPFQPPLTPKERKVMTPLRPDSRLNLSLSEMDYDTDMDSYPIKSSLPRTPRGSFSTKSSAKGSDTESGPGSGLSTPKWYKSSTVSDNERESQRARTTRAYYATRSEPFQLSHNKPPSGPPEYKHPPRFSQRKTSSPGIHYPTVQPPRRPSTHSEPDPDQGLPRKNSYQSMHSPYSEPQPTAEHVRPSTLSKSQPLKFQMSDSYLRQYSDDPTSPRGFPPGFSPAYTRGYSSGEVPAHQPQSEQQFQDLKSVSRINPIAYWEMQSRMKSTVDQVDPYHLLSEPYVRFEDVSSNPSVDESQTTIVESDGPEHQEFSSQGGGEATADILDLNLRRLREVDIDSMVTDGLGTESMNMGGGIAHFPSADCSDEYVTLVPSSSGNSTPKQLPNGYVVPSSQELFDV